MIICQERGVQGQDLGLRGNLTLFHYIVVEARVVTGLIFNSWGDRKTGPNN